MPGMYGALDLIKNELRNAVIQNLGSAPASPLKGQIYFDSSVNILYWFNGTSWIPAQSGGSLSPASTVTTQAVGDAPVVGSSANYAREDHKHGREAFGTVTPETSFGLASNNGVAATVARSDHTHGTPAAPTGVAPATTVTTQAVGDAAVVGTGANFAREDHKHGREAFGGTVVNELTFGTAAALGTASTLARSDHAHGNPTHTDPQHANIHLDALLPPINGAISGGGFQIVNVANPVNGTDVANKQYVDNAVTGMTWKNPARALAASNITQSGTQTIDGVAVVAGDRVLCIGQTTAAQNGMWVVASGAWTRSTDADSSAEIVNMAAYISEGTTYADTAWVCTNNAPITVGTTALTFSQFAGSGSIVAGAGLTQAGNVVNVVAGDTSLTVNADELHVNTSVIATVASLGSYVPTSRTITALSPLTGGGDLSANRSIGIGIFSGVSAGAVPQSTGPSVFLRGDATWVALPSKYAAALAGTASPEVITHNLNTRDIQLTVLNGGSPYTAVEVDWDATTVNTATIRYNPNLGAGYRVVIVG